MIRKKFKLITRKTKEDNISFSIQESRRDIASLEEDLAAANKDWRNAKSALEKRHATKSINLIKEEINDKIKDIENLEQKLKQEDFAEELYNFFKRLNFRKQKEIYGEYFETAENIKIGTFLIHSEGDYKDLEEQFWLWKGIFLSYLDERTTTQIVKPFFNDIQSNVKMLFYNFQESLFNGIMESEDESYNEVIEEEIEAVAIELGEKLKTNNIIIPIFLSTQMPNYQLIYEFLDIIWKPLHLHLSKRGTKNHWLKLFIIQ